MFCCCSFGDDPTSYLIEPDPQPEPKPEPKLAPTVLPEKIMRCVWAGNQYDSTGSVQPEIVSQLADELNPRLAGLDIGFHKAGSDWLWGGTCTAMALSFLQGYQELRACDRSARVAQLRERCGLSDQKFRNIQALFNGIHKTTEEDPPDFRRQRIEAMARFYKRHVTLASDTACVRKVDELAHLLYALPKGSYLLRVIEPKDNHKGESHGHSVVLLKKREQIFYYDPNYGAYHFGIETDWAERIAHSVELWSYDFSLSELRAYKVKPAELA